MGLLNKFEQSETDRRVFRKFDDGKVEMVVVIMPVNYKAGRPGSLEVTSLPSDTLGREFYPGKRDFPH